VGGEVERGMTKGSGEGWYSAFVARGGAWVIAQALVLVLALLLPRWTGHGDLVLESPEDWIGAALSVTGFLFSMVGLASLGRSLSPFPRPSDTATLRTAGIYRLVRHPIYAGLALASVGWAMWSHSLPGLLFCVPLVVFFDRKATREERWLRERFPGYAAYARRVRKLLPWLY
jgi:protein-S-isoprenylcysteine O-methyltransferase Ste14